MQLRRLGTLQSTQKARASGESSSAQAMEPARQGPAAIHQQPQQERTLRRSGDQGSPRPGQGRRQSPDAAPGPAPPDARSSRQVLEQVAAHKQRHHSEPWGGCFNQTSRSRQARPLIRMLSQVRPSPSTSHHQLLATKLSWRSWPRLLGQSPAMKIRLASVIQSLGCRRTLPIRPNLPC